MELQYRIELGVDGVKAGNVSELCTEEQLVRLLRRRAAWHTLCPSSGPFHSTVSTGREPRSLFVYGVFASAFWGGLPYASAFQFEAIKIIPSEDGVTEPLFSTTNVPHQHTVFTVDPSQDLLVLVASQDAEHSFVHIVLRELSSGFDHPQAHKPDLSLQLSYASIFARAEIAKNVVAVFAFFSFYAGTVQVWDWNSGDLLVVSISFRSARTTLILLGFSSPELRS